MNKKYVKNALSAVIAGTLLISSGVYADDSLWDKATNTANKAGKVISDTGEKAGKAIADTGEKVGDATSKAAKKVDKFVDDSTLTARVKKAIADDSLSAGFDISVSTRDGVVTLTGFVPSVDLQVKAVKIAGDVEGVKSVSDKLNIRADKALTVKSYASDAVITSEVKAKLLVADNMPLTGINVETVDGIVQLSGSVKTQEQAYGAEKIAKQADGVRSVKNDLAIRP